jgi:hypothetical protein
MSKTGTYKFNPLTKELEKVSDSIPSLRPAVYFPEADSHSGHYFESLNRTVYGKGDKRRVMKEMGVAEL